MTGHRDIALIKMKKEYSSFDDFLKDVFFKKPELSKIAIAFLQKVYSSFNGVPAEEWPRQITEFFGIYQPRDEELQKLRQLYKQHFNKEPGVKPYQQLLKLKEKLNAEDVEIIEKVAKWNSSVSSYYSMLNKLKALGLVERKKGKYTKSDSFGNNMSGLSKMFDESISSESKLYVTK